MADVEISYNGNTVVSMSDSGTEYLDTKGMFMVDNVTVNYTKSGGGGGYEDVSSQYTSSYVKNVYCVLLDRQNSRVIFSAEINTNNPEAMMGSAPVPLYACFGQTQSIVKCYYQANSTIYNDAEISGDPYLPSASFKSVCTVYCEAIVAGGGTIF